MHEMHACVPINGFSAIYHFVCGSRGPPKKGSLSEQWTHKTDSFFSLRQKQELRRILSLFFCKRRRGFFFSFGGFAT